MLANVVAALQRELAARSLCHAPYGLVAQLPSWDAPSDAVTFAIRACPANPTATWGDGGMCDKCTHPRFEGVTVEMGCVDLTGSNEVQSAWSKEGQGVNSMIDFLRKIRAWADLTDDEWTTFCATTSSNVVALLHVKCAHSWTGTGVTLAVKYADEPQLDVNPHLFHGDAKPSS